MENGDATKKKKREWKEKEKSNLTKIFQNRLK